MSINTPEISGAHAAIDSDSFASGAAVMAHQLRFLAMQTNRALTKKRPGPVAPWPVSTGAVTADDGGFDGARTDTFNTVAEPNWARIIEPIPWPKMVGHNRGEAYIGARITSGDVVNMILATRGSPWQQTTVLAIPESYLEATGTGSYADIHFSGFDLAEGIESASLFIQGQRTGDLADTATYGGVNTGVIASSALTYSGYGIEERGLYTYLNTGVIWNETAPGSDNDLASGGHTLEIYDPTTGADVVTPRTIANVVADRPNPSDTSGLGRTIEAWPRYSAPEINIARGGYSFRIIRQPRVDISYLATASWRA